MDRCNDAHSGHRNRLRQRVLSEGIEGLEPHEIIEFLLYYAIPRQDVNAPAHALIRRFSGVQGVLAAETDALAAVEGMGRRTAEYLALVGEAAAACARLKPGDRPCLGRYLDVFRFALRVWQRTGAGRGSCRRALFLLGMTLLLAAAVLGYGVYRLVLPWGRRMGTMLPLPGSVVAVLAILCAVLCILCVWLHCRRAARISLAKGGLRA